MIISHKLKVIFIKTYKTAGSSFELALSKYCGADDIYTSIKTDENIRQSWNIPEYQNITLKGKKIFRRHLSAHAIKREFSNIWDNYLKVSIIRCPYDTMISRYYWKQSKDNFSLFVLNEMMLRNRLGDYNLLCIKNRLVTDFLIRYEHLDEDIKKLEIKIGYPGLLETFQNIKDKSDFRPPRKDIYTVYSQNPMARAIIDKVYESMMQNDLVARYYPIYRERLNQEIGHPSPKYLLFAADLMRKILLFKEFIGRDRRLSRWVNRQF